MSQIYWIFILASYLLCALVIGGLVAAIVIDHRRLLRELARLGAAPRNHETET